MEDQEDNIEKLENQFPNISGSAFADAREQHLARGNSVLQSEQGQIFEVFPDGRRVFIKNVEPPTSNVPGRKITLQ